MPGKIDVQVVDQSGKARFYTKKYLLFEEYYVMTNCLYKKKENSRTHNADNRTPFWEWVCSRVQGEIMEGKMDGTMRGFDPLEAKYTGSQEVVIAALKREIQNILNSYVGWYDPFCELIQNALDAVDKRREKEADYTPLIHILIDLRENMIAVTDNGIGFKEEEYYKFLAPNFSFKPQGITRGHKGVGTTYLAYGFNYIQIATKTPDFESVGVMKEARNWLENPTPVGNPRVVPDKNEVVDDFYAAIDRGTSMAIKCDAQSYPKDLSWIGLNHAKSWLNVLRIQTGLGQINSFGKINVTITVIDKSGKITEESIEEPTYLSIDEFINKSVDVDVLKAKMDELYRKTGPNYKMPAKFSNMEAVYGKWNTEKLLSEVNFSDTEISEIHKYKVTVIFSYVYSLAVWDKIDEAMGIRKNSHVLYGGIQLAANNMPQGELIQIPLTKNIGRQKQANILIHFANCSADLGRKGFKKEITDLGKEIAKKIMDGPLQKMRSCFKANSGASPDLKREQNLRTWKNEMEKHEQDYPLTISNPHFFNPTQKIAITSVPEREQDVIALFNQLLAGGVIRGIRIMSTNERSTYDSLYRITMEGEKEFLLFDEEKNPLGVTTEVVDELMHEGGFVSEPKVLEYKFSLDGLIGDIETGVKNTNDINLVVAWESGKKYKDNFFIESLLVEGNEILRQYHGITHRLHDANTSEYVCDIVLLKDLILYLNKSEDGEMLQESYDE